MNIQAALKSQYHAALAMLRQTIERCPEDLWTAGHHPRTYWRIAYHALFFTHFYLQPNEGTFRRWEGHREDCQRLAFRPPNDPPKPADPYTKLEMLDYWRICDAMVDDAVDQLDLDSADCGFPWYHMPKLDHQMMNIRHIQQHVGQLTELSYEAGVDLDWIGQRQ